MLLTTDKCGNYFQNFHHLLSLSFVEVICGFSIQERIAFLSALQENNADFKSAV